MAKNKPKIPTPILFSELYAKALSDAVTEKYYSRTFIVPKSLKNLGHSHILFKALREAAPVNKNYHILRSISKLSAPY